MSTLKQRQSSRANGSKTRGPVTSEGKRISSRNSLHHGLLANSVVLTGESRERFEKILERLDDEYEPETESERALVDMMAIARWRHMRLWGFERATIDREIAKRQAAAAPDSQPADLPAQGADAFRDIADNSRALDLLNRYESMSYRMFMRTRKELRALQPPEEPEAPSQGEETEKRQTNLDFGFTL